MICRIANRILLVASMLAMAAGTSFLLASCAFARTRSGVCSVTKPNGDTPPGQSGGPDWYGNGALWTVLFRNGVVEFRPRGPGFILPDGSLMMKFPWWRRAEGKLLITGRRVDASAPPLRAEVGQSGDVHMVPTYIIFPTAGCWEVTGKVGETRLVFVTRVVKIGKGPES